MFKSSLVTAFALFVSFQASAAEVEVAKTKSEMRPHVGLLGGIAKAESGDMSFNYGIDAGFQPVIPFSVGIQLSHFSYTKSNLGNDIDISVTPILLKGAYNFGDEAGVFHNFFVGAKTGLVLYKASIGNTSDSSTKFAIGPNVGADWNIHPQVTVGPEISYIPVFDGLDLFEAQGVIKYWF